MSRNKQQLDDFKKDPTKSYKLLDPQSSTAHHQFKQKKNFKRKGNSKASDDPDDPDSDHHNQTRLIRINDVVKLTGISKSYIYQLCKNQQFPQNIQLVHGGSSVAWVEEEVLQWIKSRIEARDSEGVSRG